MAPSESNGRVTARELYTAINDLREEQREALEGLRDDFETARRETSLGIEGIVSAIRVDINGIGNKIEEALRKYERLDQKIQDHADLPGHPKTEEELKRIPKQLVQVEKHVARLIMTWALSAMVGVSGVFYIMLKLGFVGVVR